MNKIDMPRHLEKAIGAHDLDAVVDCFTDDYDCVFPLHPARSFRGNATVRANWTMMFARLPDIHARLLGHAVDGDTVWTDWEMRGTRADGTTEVLAGVAIFGVVDGRAASARFYLEPVT
jgi:ketosteroid isomerase-like protein